MGIPVSFRVFKGSDGSAYDGITFSGFVEFKRRTNGVDTPLSAPSIVGADGGTGRYDFATTDGQALVGSEIVWMVALPPDASVQFEYGVIDGNELIAPSAGTVPLQSNALTTIATLRTELGLDSSSDDILARLINGASDSIERYCGRKFGYVSGLVEKVRGYGTELLHVERYPVWQVTDVVINGQDFNSDYWKISKWETGTLFAWNTWPDTAPVELSASPHPRAGFEDKAIAITYCGGFALPAADRIASDAPAWVADTAYQAGSKVTNGDNVYVGNTAGTAAASGDGPTGMGTAIADGAGTLLWDFLCPAFPLPTDLEEACLQLCVFRYRRRGKDLSIQNEMIGRTSRMYTGRIAGPDGIPQAIQDVLDMYKQVF